MQPHETDRARDPKISVIIPCYNYARFVQNAINSVYAQTHESIECIVVDDGSTDETEHVVKKTQATYIKIENRGQSGAIRAALPHATGDVVIILDADDQLNHDACAELAKQWDPDIAAFQFELDVILPDGTLSGSYPTDPLLKSGHLEFTLKHGFLPSSPQSGNAYSRQFLSLAMANPDLKDRAFADGYLNFSAPTYGRIAVIEKKLGKYLLHGSNVSQETTLNGLRHRLLNHHSHIRCFSSFANARGYTTRSILAYLGPYLWRSTLTLSRLDGENPLPFKVGRAEALARGCAAFLCAPRLGTWVKLKNIFALLVIAIAPRPLVAAVTGHRSEGA